MEENPYIRFPWRIPNRLQETKTLTLPYCMLLKKKTTQKKNGESLEKVARRKPEKAGESIQNSRRKPLLAPEKAKPEKARRKPEKAGEC